VTNNSTGDQLGYAWSVSPAGGVSFSDATAAAPVITALGPIGNYTLTVVVANPVCDPITQTFPLLISQPPTVSLAEIPDGCETTVLTPVPTYTPTGYIDEFSWSFPDGNPVSSLDSLPQGIVYNAPGSYVVSIVVTNGCGVDSAQQSFDLLKGPELDISVSDSFACIGQTLSVTNNSTGDQLGYAWSVSPAGGVSFSDATAAAPVITALGPIGDYTLTVVVSNPVCDPVSQAFPLRISDQPVVSLDTIPDFCAGASFSPMAQYSPISFIDSVYWSFPGSDSIFSNVFHPGPISYDSTGSYEVTVSVFNACGSDSDSWAFDILEPMKAQAVLDTTLGCLPDFTIETENQSTGSQLNFEWSINLPNGNIIAQENAFEPQFTFTDTGLFIIKLRVYNSVCGEDIWVDSVLVKKAPEVTLATINDFCELATLTPLVSYNSDTSRIDSVQWDFPGGNPASAQAFFPSGIEYTGGAGDYTVTVQVFNICGADSDSQTFTIDTIPVLELGSDDTVCITDGIFQLQQAQPPGGTWSGPPGSITDPLAGLVNPLPFPGGQTITLTYTFVQGECEISKDKEVLIIDLSYVDGGPDIGYCVSDSCSLLSGGTPAGGWYVGPGVSDSSGIFCPGNIGGLSDVTVTLTYYYKLPGTDCIGSDEFEVTVYALPLPAIGAADSLCINVPAQIINNSVDGASYLWTFCGGITAEQVSPLHTFIDTGFCEIQLIVTSAEGCVDSTDTQVYVSGPPISYFTMDTTSGCPVLPVTFTNESIGFEYVQYNWDFQVATSTEVQPGTVLFDQGTVDTTYFITLLAANHCGSDVHADSVIVFSAPQPKLLANQYIGCSPLEVSFNNLSVGQPDSVFWDMGNGIYSSDWLPPDQVYLAPDSVNVIYTVVLYGFNECGMDSTAQEITAKPNLVRSFFTPSINAGCEPLEVNFNNTSSPDSLLFYDWFFGDGGTSNDEDPVHTFYAVNGEPTTYTVSLIANNGCGKDTMSLDVVVYPAPEVSFQVPPVFCAQDTVQFINTAVGTNGVLWEFGDGQSDTVNINPNHAYQLPGIYTATLTAYAIGSGCPNTHSETIEVRSLPSVSFSVANLFGCPPLTVQIQNEVQDAVYFTWNFGDGNTAVGTNPGSHTYDESGYFDITLRGEDIFGCSADSVFSYIEVYPVPEASFETTSEEPCGVPRSICMVNTSSGALGFNWNFGNGDESQDNSPCKEYLSAGDYDIVLTAQNQYLCNDIATLTLTVYDKPVADFEVLRATKCEDSEVVFNNLSFASEYALWYYNEVLFDTSWQGEYTFTEPGAYQLTLVAGNGSGCTDTLILPDSLIVWPSPVAGLFFEEDEGALPVTYLFTDASSEDAISFGWDFGDGSFSAEENPVHRYLSSFDKTVYHWVMNEYDCADTALAYLNLDTLGALYIPNILEPGNADPQKQVFLPKGIGLADFHIAVYARTGQLVWESTSLDAEGMPAESWDGNFKGKPMPPGVYVWKVHLAQFLGGSHWEGMEDERGEKRKSNFLYLIR
jgi:PKD repeat protein